MGSKMRERFDCEHLARTPLRIMAPARMPNKNAESRLKAMFVETYAEFFPRSNYTPVFADTFIIGYRGEDGNYTGMIGELMNDRADYVMNFAMLSQHEHEPVRVGFPIQQTDLKIYTDSWKPDIIAVDFMHTFQNVRLEFGLWLLLSMHIVAVTYVWMDLYDFEIANYVAVYWYGMLSMIGQEGVSCPKWKPRILWLFTCVAIFIAIFGYLLNLMSSDSIVISEPPRINSIGDMFNEPFSSFKVYMYTTTNYYNFMRNSRPGTAMAAIYKRAADRANCSRLIDCGEIEFRTDSEGSAELMEFYDDLVATHDHALLTSDMVMDLLTAPSICRFRPELFNSTYASTGYITSDILTFISRKGIDPEVEKYLNFRMQTGIFEPGLARVFTLYMVDKAFDEMMPGVSKKGLQFYRCLGSLKSEDDPVVSPLTVKQRRKSAIFIAGLLGLFSLLLLAEILYHDKPRKRSVDPRWATERSTLQLPGVSQRTPAYGLLHSHWRQPARPTSSHVTCVIR
ncbi:hypothetical protein HDE_06502 [Halotydeus destructor]|nr:hypothetical protein HDE_06502 [Halotydeus destructor]